MFCMVTPIAGIVMAEPAMGVGDDDCDDAPLAGVRGCDCDAVVDGVERC